VAKSLAKRDEDSRWKKETIKAQQELSSGGFDVDLGEFEMI
jgi:hypothetical protein